LKMILLFIVFPVPDLSVIVTQKYTFVVRCLQLCFVVHYEYGNYLEAS